MTNQKRTPAEEAALAAARKAAYAAVADHERDMATDPGYKVIADRVMARNDAAAIKAGRTKDFLGLPSE